MLSNNRNRLIEEFCKFIHWAEEYDIILVYTIGNPSPDGLYSSFGLNAGIQYLLRNIYFGKKKEIKTKVCFNTYFGKVFNYLKEACNNTIPLESNYFSKVEILIGVSEGDVLTEIRKDVETGNGKVGIALFILDGDAFVKINSIYPNIINNKPQLFYGIIDHKDSKDLVDFDSNNQFDLRFTEASSTCEIICNLFIAFYLSMYKFKIYEEGTDYDYQTHKTLLKILMGGMRATTGNFLLDGHETTLKTISEYIDLYNLDAEALKVDQNLILNILEKDADN